MVTVGQLSGVAALTSAGTVTASASLAWYASWADCGVERYLAARRARSEMKTSTAPVSHLIEEFHASMLTVAASAFAFEALYAELRPLVVDANTAQAWKSSKTAAPGRIHQTLLRTCKLPNSVGSDIKWLFKLRNEAVHPVSKMGPTGPHPWLPTNVVQPQATYVLEAAERALKLLEQVFFCMKTEPPRMKAEKWIGENMGLLQATHSRLNATTV